MSGLDMKGMLVQIGLEASLTIVGGLALMAVAALFVAAMGDALFGQPRSGGKFARNRTTKVRDTVGAIAAGCVGLGILWVAFELQII